MNRPVLAILQARMSSSRLPGKVMEIVNGEPIIHWQIKRILRSKKVEDLVVATSKDSSDDVLVAYLNQAGISVYRGSLNDVFSRFLEVIGMYQPYAIVRLTGDCPLLMPEIIDQVIEAGLNTNSDYLSNTIIPTFPDGLDVEFVLSNSIRKLGMYELSDYEKEHVTVGIYGRANIFKVTNFENSSDLSSLRWTLDTSEDLNLIKFIYSKFFGAETDFSIEDILKLRSEFPDRFNAKLRSSITFPLNQGRLST